MGRREEPVSRDFYNAEAASYAAAVDAKPTNAYYERPAMQSLLPQLAGKRVLDAGCGAGVYTEWLAGRGAEVFALDASAEMVRHAKQRVGHRAEIRQADLGRPLDFLQDGSIDIVLSSLVLDHIKNWEAVFKEFYRILQGPGYLLFSMFHPVYEYTRPASVNYFDTELIESNWQASGRPALKMEYYRRPLQGVFTPLSKAGFTLDCLLEPLPTEAYEREEPEEYQELCKRPGILCVRALKE